MIKDQDLWAGSAIILFALFLLNSMGSLSFMQSIYPRVLLVLMMVSGVGIIFRAFKTFRRTGKVYHRLPFVDFLLQAAIPGAFVIILSVLITTLGFYAGSFIAMAGICVLQDFVIQGKIDLALKTVTKILLFSAGCSAGLYLCFNVLLHLATPAGFLGF
ncbi:MAG: tripartite tricarboxylate transporter TctB family protein [Synergistaceae bacterium]|jgi:hypothetical protein|nr:tripartite tricarboxylate transporter TctB family protein [Synergistaceae bacterium]